MAVRIVVRLASEADWQEAAERLRIPGKLEAVLPPAVEWPDRMIVLFPSDADPGAAADWVKTMPDVVDAYPDVYTFAMAADRSAQ